MSDDINTTQKAPAKRGRRRGSSDGSGTLLAHGEPMVWLTGGGLALALIMVIGLLALVIFQGIFTFRPVPLARIALHDGRIHQGEVTRRERYQPSEAVLDRLPEAVRERAGQEVAANGGWAWRRLVRTGRATTRWPGNPHPPGPWWLSGCNGGGSTGSPCVLRSTIR